MKVLIADLFSPVAIMEMQGAGMEVVFNKDLKDDTLTAALAEMKPQVLVVRSTKVTKEHIDSNPSLQLVVRAGAGTDTIDVAYCAQKGIYVANCPAKNANAVSELTVGMMIMIDRRMAEGCQMLHEGKWHKSMFAKCKGLKGRTVGVIGFGAIAKLVCRAARAMEMNVLVCTRTHHEGDEEKYGMRYCSQEELLAQSDIVSMHCPNTAQTKGMVNAEFLGMMKADAMLLNTSRGSVIEDEALLAKLESCPDFWYGTDVFNGEPSAGQADWSNPIAQHKRCYGTHHCGASTAQAESAIGEEALRVIKKFSACGEIDAGNCVNMAPADLKGLKKMSVRYTSKIGVLSKIFECLTMHNVNVNEMQNLVFKDRMAAVANMSVKADETDMAELVNQLRGVENVIDVVA